MKPIKTNWIKKFQIKVYTSIIILLCLIKSLMEKTREYLYHKLHMLLKLSINGKVNFTFLPRFVQFINESQFVHFPFRF